MLIPDLFICVFHRSLAQSNGWQQWVQLVHWSCIQLCVCLLRRSEENWLLAVIEFHEGVVDSEAAFWIGDFNSHVTCASGASFVGLDVERKMDSSSHSRCIIASFCWLQQSLQFGFVCMLMRMARQFIACKTGLGKFVICFFCHGRDNHRCMHLIELAWCQSCHRVTFITFL